MLKHFDSFLAPTKLKLEQPGSILFILFIFCIPIFLFCILISYLFILDSSSTTMKIFVALFALVGEKQKTS